MCILFIEEKPPEIGFSVDLFWYIKKSVDARVMPGTACVLALYENKSRNTLL